MIMSAFSMNIINSVAIVTFDTPDLKVNILSLQVIEELNEILGQLAEMGSDLKGTVIISAKERNFIAGADLSLIEGITDSEKGAAMARKGQEAFDRIAALPFTTVAAIHGSCLGVGSSWPWPASIGWHQMPLKPSWDFPKHNWGSYRGSGGPSACLASLASSNRSE
jgi:3-hydroxyacyl-CoA dehydrogenase/enoyl-CoA hydratase/3-hydroxybutyryl-CoA epimerase